MRKIRKEILLVIALMILLIVVNYSILNGFLNKTFQQGSGNGEKKGIFVERIIDGDTIESSIGNIRLLGINCPEKGETGYEEAGKYLEEKILNKTVVLKYGKEREDKYGRILAYIFLDGENINLGLVENGYANFYFPSGRDEYYSQFKDAWEKCISNGTNICEKSDSFCQECIILKEFDYTNEIVILRNVCNVDCNLDKWSIKNEGRKKLILNFTIDSLENEKISFDGVWTPTGDTLFLRDENEKLVLWKNY